jgi:hypothetical protein
MGTSYTTIQRAIPRITGSKAKVNRIKHYPENKPMKLTFKQKIRNWLMNDENEFTHSIGIDDSGPNIQSQGFRLNIYGASGGTIIETTKYDQKKDENRHSLHVVTEDKDLGEELSKIITMEQLR